MGKNKMAEVARIFGKELDEQFYVDVFKRKRIARFTVFGVEVLDEVASPCEWNMGYANLLEDLVCGRAVIVDEAKGKE